MGELVDEIEPSHVEAICPLKATDIDRARPGALPDLNWIEIDRLVVDRRYQRDLGERSVTLIRRIVREFDWARVRPAVVAAREDGRFEVLDGQHLATAAATHGGIDRIPCLVVSDADRSAKSAAFVGLNRDRVGMTALQVMKAELEMGDPVARAVADGIAAGGGRLLFKPASKGKYRPGSTVAVAALRRIAKAHGADGVARAVRIGCAVKAAPIGTLFLKALGLLLWAEEYAGALTDEAIADAVVSRGLPVLEREAGERARALGIPGYRALAQLIFQASDNEGEAVSIAQLGVDEGLSDREILNLVREEAGVTRDLAWLAAVVGRSE